MTASLHLKWVKLTKYCELSGDTVCAVRNRRKRGHWLDGRQCKRAPDGNLWVNLIAVEQWVEQWQASSGVTRQKPAKA
jgi:hypothetical protein